jgi:ABC-type glucose/galactose transport system permease subunit
LGNLYLLILSAIGIAFAWGVLKFVFKSGEDQEEGKSMMIWSIVAITILASVYGIVAIFQETLGVEKGSADIFPGLPKATK